MPVEGAPASGAHVSKPVRLFAPGQGDDEAPIHCATHFYGCPECASGAASPMLHDSKTREPAMRQRYRERIYSMSDQIQGHVSKCGTHGALPARRASKIDARHEFLKDPPFYRLRAMKSTMT